MFRHLGSFATRYRIPIIIGWILAAAVLIVTAPPLDEVSSTDQRDFLPQNAPFVEAQRVYERTFPNEFGASSTVILIDAGAGGNVHTPDIWAYMTKAEAWLKSTDAPDNIADVTSPTTNPAFADAFISPDKRIALITVLLTTPTDAIPSAKAVKAIDAWLKANPPQGFAVYQTGEASLNAQAEESTFTTMDRTIIITFALVVIALLLIYRSPVSPLIPLFSVTVAFIATVGLISHLANWQVITVVAQVNALLVVVMYGAGTDYCLFLISRFREEMADNIGVTAAARRTVHLVGESISSSAGTNFIGFTAMLLAEIGMMRSAGPMLAIGVAVSLLAGLTLTPALLATLGERAFWPGKASHRAHGRLYEATSKLVSSRPLLTIILITAVMLPFSTYGLTREQNYDFVSELPKDIPSVTAYHLLREHMGGGNLFPLTVVVTGRDALAVPREIIQLADELRAVEGVADVRSLDTPLGLNNQQIADLLRVDGQLRLLLDMDDDQQRVDPQQVAQVIGGVQRYIETLKSHFPEVADDPHLLKIEEIAKGGLLTLMLRQGELLDSVRALAERFKTIEDAYLLPPTGSGEMFAALRPLVESYVTPDGTAYKLDVVLDDPLGAQAASAVQAIRSILAHHNGASAGGAAVASGFPALMADLQKIMRQDEVRVFAIILMGIFVVLVLMLRSLIAPLYLIATVVLSFTCTLGLTSLFFKLAFGVETLSWLLPFFMFVFLVALGIDYSIFLFGRIKEEVGQHGIREGIHTAVAATGGIITSAGVILAGTFAGMMTGELAFLAQMGFAVSVGVLIDTFVVRTVLDPALATLFGRWTWWPGGVPRAAHSAPSAQAAPRSVEAALRD